MFGGTNCSEKITLFHGLAREYSKLGVIKGEPLQLAEVTGGKLIDMHVGVDEAPSGLLRRRAAFEG